VIRVDALWLAVEPLDLRAGTEAALARVVTVFGAARPHHAYLFTNRRTNRLKVLVHDGIGVWLAARRLNSGKFVWPKDSSGTLTLSRAQFAHFGERDRRFRERDRFEVGAGLRGEDCRYEVVLRG
jgi:transposase